MIRIEGQAILTAAEMRAAEDAVIATGVSVETLMERAGIAIAHAVRRLAGSNDVLILCGPGNNGGDGYVAARVLAEMGVTVRVAALSEPKTDAAKSARAKWSGPVETLANASPAPILLDALFGTGLTRPLNSDLKLASNTPPGGGGGGGGGGGINRGKPPLPHKSRQPHHCDRPSQRPRHRHRPGSQHPPRLHPNPGPRRA